MNASVYAGSAISSYGIGVLAATSNWQNTILVWLLCAVAGIIILVAVRARWAMFRK